MAKKKILFDFFVICFVAFLISTLVINFQVNFIVALYNLSQVAGFILTGITKSFFENIVNSAGFYAIVSLVSSLSSVLVVNKIKDNIKNKKLLTIFSLLFLVTFCLSTYIPNRCNGNPSIDCEFLFAPFILVITIFGVFSGTWTFVLIKKLYGIKIAVLLLVVLVVINIILSISIHKDKITNVRQSLAAGQEIASKLGHIYKPDPKEYKIWRELVSPPGGEDICVIYSHSQTTCFFTAGKYWVWKTQVTSKRFPVGESLEIIQLEPRSFGEDAAAKFQQMDKLIGDEKWCKDKLVRREVVNIKNEEKAIYGIIRSENGKCGFETHFLSVYKRDAFIVILVDHFTENKPVTLQDLMRVAEAMK